MSEDRFRKGGISMGITGTDVTKEASDMVLLDDHFASIVHAVEEGRNIYENIVKFVLFLLSANLAELFSIFFGILLGFDGDGGSYWVLLLPTQILWINLVTDGFPAVALAFDPLEPKAMHRPPRSLAEPILSLRRGAQLVAIGIATALAAIIAAKHGFAESKVLGQTMAFTALVILELGIVCLIHLPLSINSNPKLIGAVLLSFCLQLAVLYFPPLQEAFSATALSWDHWVVLFWIFLGATLVNFAILKCFPVKRRGH